MNINNVSFIAKLTKQASVLTHKPVVVVPTEVKTFSLQEHLMSLSDESNEVSKAPTTDFGVGLPPLHGGDADVLPFRAPRRVAGRTIVWSSKTGPSADQAA